MCQEDDVRFEPAGALSAESAPPTRSGDERIKVRERE